MKARKIKLRNRMQDEKIDGLLITDLNNLRYLIGFTGSNGILLLTKNRTLFFTDFRYQEQSKKEVKNATIKIRDRDLFAVFPIEELKGIKTLGFETDNLSYQNYCKLKKQIKKVRLVPCNNWTLELRAVKDNSEIRLIKKAASITDRVFTSLLNLIRPGVKEKDLACEIDYQIMSAGCEISFPTIVASGKNSALPHYRSGPKKVKEGEPIIFDFGARYEGYCSDMTRTVFLGRANDKGREIYSIVLEAQKRAVSALQKGQKASVIDNQARAYIAEKGYGKYFGHSLGHGVGLQVHEWPALAETSKAILNCNNIVTIEPGIYLNDWGGVRIEDLVRVTDDGCEVLTKSTKELIEI